MTVGLKGLEVLSAVLCEDVRNEIANKKSLMGVLAGDILVPHMPAAIQLALYIDFKRADKDQTTNIAITFFVDDEVIVKFEPQMGPTPSLYASVVIPKGIIQFEKDSSFVVKLTVEGEETEIMRKAVSVVPPITS